MVTERSWFLDEPASSRIAPRRSSASRGLLADGAVVVRAHEALRLDAAVVLDPLGHAPGLEARRARDAQAAPHAHALAEDADERRGEGRRELRAGRLCFWHCKTMSGGVFWHGKTMSLRARFQHRLNKTLRLRMAHCDRRTHCSCKCDVRRGSVRGRVSMRLATARFARCLQLAQNRAGVGIVIEGGAHPRIPPG